MVSEVRVVIDQEVKLLIMMIGPRKLFYNKLEGIKIGKTNHHNWESGSLQEESTKHSKIREDQLIF